MTRWQTTDPGVTLRAPLPPAAAPPSYYKWELLALLCLAFFFHQCDRAIFGVTLSAIRADLALDNAEMGMVGSALFLTLALLMPLAGYIGDIFNKKWLITGSLVFWSTATMFTGLAQGVWGLIAFRSIATAGGESFYAPAAYPLLAAFHQKTRALAMSVHQASLYVGVMSSGLLGGYLAQRWGWRATFYVFGACGLVLGFVFIFRLRSAPSSAGADSPAVKVGPVEALGVLFRTPSAMLLTVGFTAIVMVNNAYVVWAPAFMQEKFGLSLIEAGTSAMFYHHAAALAGVLVGGPLSDAMVTRRPRFRLALQTGAMLLGAPAILWLGQSATQGGTELAMAAFGLFRGLYESNTHASLFDVIRPRYRASAVGMMTMLAFLAGSASPWALGLLRDAVAEGRGLSLGFSLLSLAYLVGGIAVAAAAVFTFARDRVVEKSGD